MNLQAVKALQDDSGHWYLIHNINAESFLEDLKNKEMCDSGDFDKKWGCYRTGGDLNLVQLYIED